MGTTIAVTLPGVMEAVVDHDVLGLLTVIVHALEPDAKIVRVIVLSVLLKTS
ncbi:MAG: hypothetical protein J5641_04805 [Bacteroidales bacterium]|nr:hypothetical protein [Bacteroidales bacterium]